MHHGPITKSIYELIEEVNSGNYQDFRSYLAQNEITNLDLSSYLPVDMNGRCSFDFRHLAQALKDTPVISLNLQNNNLGTQGAEKACAALRDSNIKTLNLRYNNIDCEGGMLLGKALQGSALSSLNLRDNNLGDEGAIQLCAALSKTQIQILNLRCNGVHNEAMEELANRLIGTQVVSLNLGENFIDCHGAVDLCKGLKNTQVTSLGLKYNNLHFAGRKIADCISETLLIQVKLGFEDENLQEALKENAWKINWTPYTLARLVYLSDEQKLTLWNLLSSKEDLGTDDDIFNIGASLFVHSGKDVQSHILKYFPMMDQSLVFQYQLLAENKYKQKTEKNEPKIKVDNLCSLSPAV